jgi:predicted MFS family arabinose efflux permease
VIIVADLAQHTGRFNLMQGAMNTCVASGASLSNLLGGFVADRYGYRAAFTTLTALALLALMFFWASMPETATGVHTPRK